MARLLAPLVALALLLSLAPAAGAATVRNTSADSISTIDVSSATRLAESANASECGSQKAHPGASGGGTFHFRRFSNDSLINETACLTVQIGAPTCSVFAGSYEGVFDRDDIAAGYRADPGAAGSSLTYSFDLRGGASFQTIVWAAASGGQCSSYGIFISADLPWGTSRPFVGGHPHPGAELVATGASWAGSPTIARQWRRCALDGTNCADIEGATGETYTPAPSDVGHTVVYRQTATESGKTASMDARPVQIGVPLAAHTGSLAVGDAVQSASLQWRGPASRCAGPPRGAPAGSAGGPFFYDVFGHMNETDGPLCVIVSLEVSGCSGDATPFSAAYLPSYQPGTSVTTNWVADHGQDSRAGSVPSYAFDVPSGAAYEVMTQVAEPNATCDAYGLRIATAAPYPTTAPAVGGTAVAGQTLSLADGAWTGEPAFTRQWLRCDGAGADCTDIAGATGATYRLGRADVGRTIRARVTATQGAGSAAKSSAPTAAVALPPYPGIALRAQTRRASRKGVVTLRLRCPALADASCKGTDALRLGKRKLGAKRFSIAAGKSARVRVKLTRKARRLLARKRKLAGWQVVASRDARGVVVTKRAKLTLKAPKRGRRR